MKWRNCTGLVENSTKGAPSSLWKCFSAAISDLEWKGYRVVVKNKPLGEILGNCLRLILCFLIHTLNSFSSFLIRSWLLCQLSRLLIEHTIIWQRMPVEEQWSIKCRPLTQTLKLTCAVFPLSAYFLKFCYRQLGVKLCPQGPMPFDSSEYVLTAILPFQRNIQTSSSLLTSNSCWALGS